MKISALLSQSLHSIRSNKVRSSLTILGIVIGIAAVIALVGIGNTLKAGVSDMIGGLGITRITVMSHNPNVTPAERRRESGDGLVFRSGEAETLTETDYHKVKQAPGIEKASPKASIQADVALTASSEDALVYQFYGVSNDYFSIQKLTAQSGSLLTTAQVEDGGAVAVLSKRAASQLFPSSSPVGQKAFIKGVEFTIIGVLAEADQESYGPIKVEVDGPAPIYTGYKTWLSVSEKKKFKNIIADATSEETVVSASRAIEDDLLAAHGISDETDSDINIATNKSLLDAANAVTSGFTLALAGIAAISLVVGGIGIMNIMLVTVTERTREIGLRRAVGAKTRHILLQFLIESIMLTMIGGIIGLIIGIGFSLVAGQLLSTVLGVSDGAQTMIDGGTILLAVGVSVAIGIVFGLFPAIKATRLDPVEALRYE